MGRRPPALIWVKRSGSIWRQAPSGDPPVNYVGSHPFCRKGFRPNFVAS